MGFWFYEKSRVIVTSWLLAYKNVVKWISRGVNLLAVIVLIYWIIGTPIIVSETTFEQEPLLVGLTMLFAILNQFHRWLLNESEYSPAYALASGYFTNFLSPVITQLIENGEKKPVIYIYKPKHLSELFKNNVDRVKAKIQNNKFEVSEVNLSLKHARARDVLIIQKSKTKKIYFDFPNTLISLIAYVDYKVVTGQNSSFDKAKEKLTSELINKFYEKMDELILKDNISANVRYCDQKLKFDFEIPYYET